MDGQAFLKFVLGLFAVSGGLAPAPARAQGFDRIALLGGTGENHRSLGLVKSGFSPVIGDAAPPCAAPELARLLAVLAAAPPDEVQAPLEVLYDGDGLEPSLIRYRQRMLENLWGVRYLLTDPDTGAVIVSPAPEAYRVLYQYGEPLQLVALEKRFYLPRFYFRSAVLPVSSPQAFITLLAKPGAFRPFHQVAIEQPRQTPEQEPNATTDDAQTETRLVYEGEGRVSLELNPQRAGYLVLAETLTRDWQVRVDGQPAVPERANGYQGAVRLTPGFHRVEVDFGTRISPPIP